MIFLLNKKRIGRRRRRRRRMDEEIQLSGKMKQKPPEKRDG
jgi:hypothetical protein